MNDDAINSQFDERGKLKEYKAPPIEDHRKSRDIHIDAFYVDIKKHGLILRGDFYKTREQALQSAMDQLYEFEETKWGKQEAEEIEIVIKRWRENRLVVVPRSI